MEFLKIQHPTYSANIDAWKSAEKRYAGGHAILDELIPFDWETEDGKSITNRRLMASYMNFPALFAETVVGSLYRHAPAVDSGLDYGTLGKVVQEGGSSTPSRASLVYYNTDGTGQDGSQWDEVWSEALKRAMVTGFRWMFVEAPEMAPGNMQAEIDGLRPYLLELSPVSVPNWHEERGTLMFVVVDSVERRITADEIKDIPVKILYVRRGYDALGSQFAQGGWWKFDEDNVLLASGTWDKTNGEIPAARLKLPRAMTFELGQLAVSEMNLDSAGDNDAIEGGGRKIYVQGITKEAHKEISEQINSGSKLIGIPPVLGDENKTFIPQLYDSAAASASSAIDMAIKRKLERAERLMLNEVALGAGISGASRDKAHRDGKAPLLTQLARSVESTQNTVIRFFELRFGNAKPTGSVNWPKDYDLAPLVEDVQKIMDLMRLSGTSSPTLIKNALIAASRDVGLMEESDKAAVEKELDDSYQRTIDESTAVASLTQRTPTIGEGKPGNEES